MKKILLIEYNKDIRENTAEILTLANYNVLTAANGKEGVEIALKEMPDIIVCDIMMPVLDGYGVLHLLSKNTETANIPFIFLTAKADQIDFRKGMEMGADDYITKPFDDIQLLNAIEVRLKKNEILKKEFSKNIEGIEEFIVDIKEMVSLEKISKKTDLKYYNKKDNIYKEGSYAKGVYFINSGKVKTYRTNEFGKELITQLYSPGDFFGHLSLLKEEKYDETATALDDVEIYMIVKEDFLSLIYKNPEVSKKFISILSNNVVDTQKKLIQIAYDSVRKRAAEALVELSNKYKKDGEAQFTISIGREDMANIVGTSTETIVRALTEFRQDKLIDVSGSSITILNYQKLKDMRN
jgi:CRP-like cAMP-binding protein/CheY-like chemotaxis protein